MRKEKVGSFDREMERVDEIIKSSSRNDPDERRCTRAKYVSSRNGTMEEAWKVIYAVTSDIAISKLE